MDSKRLCTEVAGDLVPGTKLHISMLGKWILQQILLYQQGAGAPLKSLRTDIAVHGKMGTKH